MTKSRWWLYSVVGLVAYLLFLLLELPATWLAWGLNRQSQGVVRLDPNAGSLWSGHGNLVVYYPSTTPHNFGQTEWRVHPFWLLVGHVQVSLRTGLPDQKIETTIQLSGNRIRLRDTDADLSAAFLTQFYPPLILVSPQGRVKFRTPDLAIEPNNVAGAATLEWLNAATSLADVPALGDYRLDITGSGKNAGLKLTTLRGNLELTGQGQWQPGTGQVQFQGAAMPRAQATELAPLLNTIGPDLGGGRRNIAINTRLPLAVATTK